jgi:hypothetical protein
MYFAVSVRCAVSLLNAWSLLTLPPGTSPIEVNNKNLFSESYLSGVRTVFRLSIGASFLHRALSGSSLPAEERRCAEERAMAENRTTYVFKCEDYKEAHE